MTENAVPSSGRMFDPETYDAVRRPVEEAESLPPWCYTSDAFYRREVEQIFMKSWICVGRQERIPKPGDYFTMDNAGVPVLIVRGDDGNVRAFANSCRHRGTPVATDEGNCSRFICPYHSWTYSLEGTLLSAPTNMDETVGFDMADYGLTPIRLDTWAGFMFIAFSDNTEALASWLGNLPEQVAPWNLENMIQVRRKIFDLSCNWKVYVENAKDQLHLMTVHAKTLNKVSSPTKVERIVLESEGQVVNSMWRSSVSMAVLKGDEGFPPIPTLTGEYAGATTTPMILPTIYIGCTVDCAYYLIIRPKDAGHMELEQGGMFPREIVERPDFEQRVQTYHHRWDATLAEDNELCQHQQQGLASPFCAAGRFSNRERAIHQISNWILDRVLGTPETVRAE